MVQNWGHYGSKLVELRFKVMVILVPFFWKLAFKLEVHRGSNKMNKMPWKKHGLKCSTKEVKYLITQDQNHEQYNPPKSMILN